MSAANFWWFDPHGARHALTGWIGGRQKPVMEGVYQRLAHWLIVYAVFDGRHWLRSALTIDAALQHRGERAQEQYQPWRGLAAPPYGGYGREGH